MCTGAGGTVGQPESAAAHWLPASPRELRARRRWRGRCAPGRPWQPGHCLALRARRRRRGRCAPGRQHLPPACVTAHVVSWGEWGCRRSRVLRAARKARCKACFELLRCRGRGWGGTPRGPCCHRLRHTRAENRYSGSWQEGGARAASLPLPPRSRAAGAPATRRGRAVGGACACRARSNGRRKPCGGWVGVGGWWWHQLRMTSGWLPL